MSLIISLTLSIIFMISTDTITLFEFNNPDELSSWQSIDDNVMGGISSSILDQGDTSTAIFSGNLSLANNGGFASIRSKINQDLFTRKGIILRIKGDGKAYSFRVRTDNNFDGISYQQKFKTNSNEWEEITLPFTNFTPTFRGRLVTNAKPIKSSDIKQIGFMISDKQEGKFRFEIDWIKSF